jgi:hypothetical protein
MELEILVQSKREQLLDIYTQSKTLKEKIQFLKKMTRLAITIAITLFFFSSACFGYFDLCLIEAHHFL